MYLIRWSLSFHCQNITHKTHQWEWKFCFHKKVDTHIHTYNCSRQVQIMITNISAFETRLKPKNKIYDKVANEKKPHKMHAMLCFYLVTKCRHVQLYHSRKLLNHMSSCHLLHWLLFANLNTNKTQNDFQQWYE